jgi:hypothetical protein
MTITGISLFLFYVSFKELWCSLCCNRCACGGSVSTDSFNGMKHAVQRNKLLDPPSYDSPHIGTWAEIGVWISSWIFLKDAKHAFTKPAPSQSGWLINICAVQYVWRMLEKGRFQLS